MTCFSSYIVGGFAIALLIVDMIQHEWNLLWMHALGGTALTGIFWLLCKLLGDSISLAILVIPTLFFLVFGFGIWVTGQSLKRQGCCIKCGSSSTDPGSSSTDPGSSSTDPGSSSTDPGSSSTDPGSSTNPGTVKKEDEMCRFTQQLKGSILI